MLIKNLINNYLDMVKIYRTKGTYDYYKKVSRSIIRALEYNKIIFLKDLNENSQTKIVLYFLNITKKKNSQINADISFLYTVLRFSKLEHSLTPFIKLKDDTTPFRVIDDITLKEMVKWIRTLDISLSNNLTWSLTIFLMLETGVRMNELLNIKSDNIDLTTNTIILEETKNGLRRVVFFDSLSRDLIIKSLANKKEYLIWNYSKNTRMTRAGLFYFFNLIDKELKPNIKITSHRLRKTFATRLLKNGCNITTIQKLLGHGDIKMTMKYLEVDKYMIEEDYYRHYPYRDLK